MTPQISGGRALIMSRDDRQFRNHSEASGAVDRQAILQHYRQHVSSGFAKLAEFMALPVEMRSCGSLIFDENDTAYLDCGGYGVFILGHCHPAVIQAVQAQLDGTHCRSGIC